MLEKRQKATKKIKNAAKRRTKGKISLPQFYPHSRFTLTSPPNTIFREPVELEDEPRDQPRDENHDFSQLIDQKAPVPRYHPINPPKRLFLDDMLHNTHSCLECGDEFMFESSLKAHYERTSIIIEVRDPSQL